MFVDHLQNRDRFYSNTFKPVTIEDGTRYDQCSAEDISAYTSPVPGRPALLSRAEGIRVLNGFLSNDWPNKATQDALERIRRVIRTPGWGPDVLIKVSHDMDTAFFNGHLRSRVLVSWQDEQVMHTIVPDFRYLFGCTSHSRNSNTCLISLNRVGICYGPAEPRRQMFQTLTHEMLVSSNNPPPPPQFEIVLTVA